MTQKINRSEIGIVTMITDCVLTSQDARLHLYGQKVKVTKYRNRENPCAVVHSHPYRELIIPLAGSRVRYSVGGEVYDLEVGQMIMIPENIYHSAQFNVIMDYSERLVLQVEQEIWEGASQLCHLDSAPWQTGILVLDESVVMKWKVKELFERMPLSEKIGGKAESIVLYCHLMELIVLIEQAVQARKVRSASESSQLVAQAARILQEEYTNPNFTVTKLATNCFTSREHLSRIFKSYTLRSIQEYLIELRMQHFRKMIAEGYSILEGCTASGFPDYSSFLKCFRNLYGITPSQYRKQVWNEESYPHL